MKGLTLDLIKLELRLQMGDNEYCIQDIEQDGYRVATSGYYPDASCEILSYKKLSNE